MPIMIFNWAAFGALDAVLATLGIELGVGIVYWVAQVSIAITLPIIVDCLYASAKSKITIVQGRMKILKWFLVFLATLLIFCCMAAVSRRNVDNEWIDSIRQSTQPRVNLFEGQTGQIIIERPMDLNDCEGHLPENVTLIFKKGACISNGTLVGSNTKVVGTGGIFNRVHITGTWNVPVIKSSMFADLVYDNSLKDVMALSSPDVKNEIVIEDGEFQVTAQRNEDICLNVNSNTKLTINGTIKLTPNNFRNYYIVQASGDNITINGYGTIIGDRPQHTGKDGEWGMGIYLNNAHNTKVNGITVKDCWGDCLYIGSNSSDIEIKNCYFDGGRRQGISITSGERIKIRKCNFTNVGGTAPEYAIDIEPNAGERVQHVLIEGVTVENCKGGFLVCGSAKDAHVEDILIRKSTVGVSPKRPVSLESAWNVQVKNCVLCSTQPRTFISCENIRNSEIIGNELRIEPSLGQRHTGLVRGNRTNINDISITTNNSKGVSLRKNSLIK